MREIKFRAFDGDKKEMILPEYAEREDFHILADGQIVETHEYGYERHELTSKRPNSWVLMQYTGLKDKNGKEIYEGDIVKTTTSIYEIKRGIGGMFLQETCIDGDEYLFRQLETEICEVIGNIYENPELLTK